MKNPVPLLTIIFSFLLQGAIVSLGFAQASFFPIPSAQPGTISSGNKGPNGSVDFHRAAFIYPAADVSLGNIPNGSPLTGIGFYIASPAATAATGTLRVWIGATLDQNFNRSLTWADLLTSPVPLQQVYDGPLTIPAQTGWYDVAFNLPNALPSYAAGTGYYVAYEWIGQVKAAASPVYTVSVRPATFFTATGTTPPSTIAAMGGSRPWLRLKAATGLFTDPAIVATYFTGRLPLLANGALPERVQALLTNNGNKTAHQVAVNLNITGPSPFQATMLVDSIRQHDSIRLHFPVYTPASAGGHLVQVSLRQRSDSISYNNSISDSMLVIVNELSCARGTRPGTRVTSTAGFNTASGTLLTRYVLHAPAVITAATAWIDVSTNLVGKSIFGVLLSGNGQLLARSADHVINQSDLGKFVYLNFSNSIALPAGPFLVGIGQQTSPVGQGFFPLGTQLEPYVRDSSYYYALGDSALLGLRQPQELRSLGRLLLGAVFTQLLSSDEGPSENVSISPNPSDDGWFFFHFSNSSLPYRVVIQDLLGRTITQKNVIDNFAIDLRSQPPGLYFARLTWPDGRSITQRLIRH